MVIWKYTLEWADRQKIEVPKGATVLSVLNQRESLVVYFLVDPAQEKEDKYISIVGTGNPFPYTKLEKNQFIGTASIKGGDLVWHVFIEP